MILFLIASLLKWTLSPVLYLYGFFSSISKGEFKKYHKDLAISKDQYGNVLGQYFWNDIFIKKGIKFGNVDETMSSVIGKNYEENTLTPIGKELRFILDTLQKNHSVNSIEKDE